MKAPNLIARYVSPERIDPGDGPTILIGMAVFERVELDDRMRYGSSVEDSEHDNLRRADSARAALAEYVSRDYGGEVDCEPAGQGITDLLTNLMHLADAWGLDFEKLLRKASNHYQFEMMGEAG